MLQMLYLVIFGLFILFHFSTTQCSGSISENPPVIDISPLLNRANISEANNTVERIRLASEKWGFFYITNFGINKDLIEAVKSESAKFFNSTVKYSIRRTQNNARGFADDELTKQLVDKKEIFDFGHTPNPLLPSNHPDNVVMDGYNQWPEGDDFKEFRHTLERYYSECAEISKIIINAIAVDILGDKENTIDQAFENHTSFMRLNFYPLQQPSITISSTGDGDEIKNFDLGLGISRHTDAGALTLLMQDTPGLEVYTGSKQDFNDGYWTPVNPVEGTLTVNIGDMMQVWSNGKLKAAEHRVLQSLDFIRYSTAFFFNPSYSTIVEPLVLPDDPSSKFKPIQWGIFRKQRFMGDFENIGEEVQIQHYLN